MRALLTLLISLSMTSTVLAANWLEVSVDNDGYYFLDADSITTVNRRAGIISVWVKAMFEDNDRIKRADGGSYELNKILAQEFFDCTHAQYQMVQVISYDETDTIQDSHYSKDAMKNIAQDSNDADAIQNGLQNLGEAKSQLSRCRFELVFNAIIRTLYRTQWVNI